MGKSKSDSFTAEQNRLAGYAKALAHPARIAIIEHLVNKGSCVCGDIVEELPLSQSTVSQHLRELKKAGIIQGNIEGTSVCYCLDTVCCNGVANMLKDLLSMTKGCC
ncbi:MAG: metalloregulator ArsR/SmtB family transcription factor [Bacteroidota bacterium]